MQRRPETEKCSNRCRPRAARCQTSRPVFASPPTGMRWRTPNVGSHRETDWTESPLPAGPPHLANVPHQLRSPGAGTPRARPLSSSQ
ncbi:hypothetical protein ebD25 [Aromatoleum aromaticum EbN1]|uniref:Uncharacterized protein n=1 Tax=Aromatoleum aromaticum (strain DSM 19018 / LMG 30748 / EbN1) TaxID=76114 RepID=Q5P937_AROAE|nr:hypothetical protein ebD25 [Aromatoleum aromaticum EbN1]